MLEGFKNKSCIYEKLSKDEQSKRGILGRLTGIIADTNNPTRNGRKYSLDLWQKVFDNKIMQEKIANRCCFGELGHPADREEIDMEKIAVCLAETPKIGDDGNLYGVFDILSTPNGRILKSLCDYGCTVGVSSRGTGDIITDSDGNEAVDPDTYECECFDIVLVPAVESARMSYVTESLDTNKTSELKKSLFESLNKASDNDKKIMLDTLKELNIDLDDSKELLKEDVKVNNISESADSKKEVKELDANDDGSDELIKSLQETLLENKNLKAKLKSLQEQLAVSDTKVNKLNEDLNNYKSATVRLSRLARKSKVQDKELPSIKEELEKSEKMIATLQTQNKSLMEDLKSYKSDSKGLKESVNSSNETVKQLNEKLKLNSDRYEKEVQKIKESYTSKLESSNKQLNKQTKLTESYKKLANNTINKYISLKATMLGISENEIKNKLNESFTLKDVDRVCDSIVDYNLNINKLPFNLNRCARVKVTESKEPIKKYLPTEDYQNDDDVDDTLVKMAGIK